MHLTFNKSYDDTPDDIVRTIFEFEISKKTSMPLPDEVLVSIITLIQQNRPDYIPTVPAYLVVAQKQIGQRKFSLLQAFFVLESESKVLEKDPRTKTPIPEAIKLNRILKEYDCKSQIVIWMVNAMAKSGTNPFWAKVFPISGRGESEE